MLASSRAARAAILATVVAIAIAIAFAGSAGAATRNGITPLAPEAGASVPAGESPVFRMRVQGPGQVWVHVCKSKRKDSEGVICTTEAIGRAKKRNGVFRYKPRFFDFPGFWLNSPGTYYWQTHRISCNAQDCRQEGPVVRFKVS